MSYVISAQVNGVNHCIRANINTNSFELIPVQFDSDLSKVFRHPNKTGALNILKWIKANDKQLSSKDLCIQPEAKFIK
jgi:hypothetical protein